jgi:hypothetical protein
MYLGDLPHDDDVKMTLLQWSDQVADFCEDGMALYGHCHGAKQFPYLVQLTIS